VAVIAVAHSTRRGYSAGDCEASERDRLKALPAEPDRWDEQLTGELYSGIYQALPVSERGAWLTSHGFLVHATKREVTVIQGDVRGTAHLK
jgi:hypothetical protein